MKHSIRQIKGIIGLSILLLTSCSGESAVNGDAGKELVVSAAIIPSGTDSKALTGTLANGTDKQTFENTDKIKITRSSDNTSRYYLLNNSKWLPETEANGITTDGSEHTYTAIYPFDFDNIQGGQDEITSSGLAENFAKSDKLESAVTTSSNYVPFKFKHAFTKITISVAYKAGSERKDVTAQLTGVGICTNGTGPGNETINMLRTSSNDAAAMNHTFICILYPGETRTFVLKVNGKTSDDITANEETFTQTTKKFESGYNYIYNFSSNDNLILNSVTVKDFDEGGTTDMGSAT